MKQLIDSSQHARATNYAKHKMTEGVSDTRIIGELVALENLRKSTAIEITQQAKRLLEPVSPHTEVLNLYEWIQDWLVKGLSHHQITHRLKTKGIDETQARELLQKTIDFQISENEKTSKAKNISVHSPEIYRQIQVWRKQLMSPYVIKQKLQQHYDLNKDEAQGLLCTALLHKKAQQTIEIEVRHKHPPNNWLQCFSILSLLLLCTLGAYSFTSGVTSRMLIALCLLGIAGFIAYKLTRRSHNKVSYLK